MRKTYFAVSDLHSHFSEFLTELKNNKFKLKNKNHIIIIDGDLFDRGDESLKLYNFIRYQIPKDRRILIRGNHEYLLRDLVKKPLPDYADIKNGTLKTIFHLIDYPDIDYDEFAWSLTYLHAYDLSFIDGDYKFLQNKLSSIWKKIKVKFKSLKIIDWIFSDEWCDYFEIKNYIFTHSFIPIKMKNKDKTTIHDIYDADGSELETIKNWRTNATKNDWESAAWGCPYKFYDAGLFDEEKDKSKILVVGHWCVSDFYDYFEDKEKFKVEKNHYKTFISDHLVGLDGCIHGSNICNMLKLKL